MACLAGQPFEAFENRSGLAPHPKAQRAAALSEGVRMKPRQPLLKLASVLCLAMSPALGEAQALSGEHQFPRDDRENRAIQRERPAPVQIHRRVLPGSVIARGTMIDRNRDGVVAPEECQFNYGFEIRLYSGSRTIGIRYEPDCTAVLEDVVDVDVIEPEDRLALRDPTSPGRVRSLFGRLMDALFPTVHAQAYINKGVYEHIYTYGGGGPSWDGLTAQQGWLEFRYNGSHANFNSALGYFCVDGRDAYGNSYCRPPMGIPPMNPAWTGWYGYNPHIVARCYGPSNRVCSHEHTSFFWDWGPPEFNHTLENVRYGYWNGTVACSTWVTGNPPSGTSGVIRAGCLTYTP